MSAKSNTAGLAYLEMNLSIDPGNSFVKVVYDELDNDNTQFSFPNIISRPIGQQQGLMRDTGNPLDYLEVKLSSKAIDDPQFNHIFVGNRAAADEDGIKQEIKGDKAKQTKAERTQTVALILTAAAAAVARKAESAIREGQKKIKANINLISGLPVAEIVDHRDAFQEKLEGTHVVTFCETPIFRGVEITIEITMPAGVAIDDVSAAYDIEDSTKLNLSAKRFGMADLGGVDMDVVFFNKDLDLDQLKTFADKILVNDALDKIRQEVNSSCKMDVIATNADLVNRIVSQDLTVYPIGKAYDISPIVRHHLSGIGLKVLGAIRNAWSKVSYATEFLLVGGSAVLLRPYIKEANTENYNIHFDDDKYAQYRNVRGAFRELIAMMEYVKNDVAAAKEE